MPKLDYISILHTGKIEGVETLSAFMDFENIYNITPEELFNFNKGVIFQQMTEEDWSKHKDYGSKEEGYEWKESDLYLEMILPSPCFIGVFEDNVTSELVIDAVTYKSQDLEDEIQKSTGFINWSRFISSYYTSSLQYIKFNQTETGEQKDKLKIDITKDLAKYFKQASSFTVLGWFKTINSNIMDTPDLRNTYVTAGTVISDISKYIININTNVDENGGNFTLTLPYLPLTGEENFYQDLVTFENANEKYKFFDLKTSQGLDYSLYDKNDTNSKFDFFSSLLSSNDLLFLSMEHMPEIISKPQVPFEVDNKEVIPDLPFDMICLIDSVSIQKDFSGNATISVSGRDLVKLLIDDSSNFFQSSTTPNPVDIFGNYHEGEYSVFGRGGDMRDIDQQGELDIDPIKRLRRVTGEIDIFANRTNMTLSFILKGVISKLSNIEIVGGNLFEPWKDKRTRFSELYPENFKKE